MSEILILFVFAALFTLYFLRPKWKAPETKASGPEDWTLYQAVDSLFVNRSELAFFHALNRELPTGYYVHSKVRLEDIIRVRTDLVAPKLKWQLRGRIKWRHVDFLVTDEAGRPVMAIELDGRSHQNSQAHNADHLKNGLFKTAGIPLHRVRTGENFNTRSQSLVETLKSP